jgi:hypothetical protein
MSKPDGILELYGPPSQCFVAINRVGHMLIDRPNVAGRKPRRFKFVRRKLEKYFFRSRDSERLRTIVFGLMELISAVPILMDARCIAQKRNTLGSTVQSFHATSDVPGRTFYSSYVAHTLPDC